MAWVGERVKRFIGSCRATGAAGGGASLDMLE